jgi:predicted nucleic acid-binding protein
MEWVFDASVALAWCFEDKSTAHSESLLEKLGGQPAVVPGHWSLEVANVLTLAVRAGRITPARRAAFIRMFDSFSLHVDPETHNLAWSEILRLADGLRLTSYDAAYLELAIRMDVPLATNDAALQRAARANGVVLL